MSVDYHQLLWQQLNRAFAEGPDNVLLMNVGKFLLYTDYSLVSGNEKGAAQKTFELTDACVGCNPNYNPTGSHISVLWKQLLYHGKGPEAGPAQQAAFREAKKALFKNYEADTPTPLYQSYLDAELAYKKEALHMKEEYQEKYGDGWEARYDEAITATAEYANYTRLEKRVGPHLKAIDDWKFGPYADVMAPMIKAFKDNKRSVELPDGKEKEYFYVSMIPSSWYQWFDLDQPEGLDGPWAQVTVDENSYDATQAEKFTKLAGRMTKRFGFFSITPEGEYSKEEKVTTEDSRGIKISFKVRAVEIRRPWVDLAALNSENWKIPGQASGAWSTGVLDSSNGGSFPLLTTQMIVAKDITVTAERFSKKVTDSLTKFKAKVDVGLLFGLFSFGAAGGERTEKTHSFHFDAAGSSFTLKGTQVIGYTGKLVPYYPA